MKKTIAAIILLMFVFTLTAQTETAEAKKSSVYFGIETDLFAWRIGELFENIYFGFWIGIPHWKFSYNTGVMNVNPGHLPDFVKANTMYLSQIRADWFWNKELDGFWIGPSLLAEVSKVVSTEDFKSKVFIMSGGLSTGYLFKTKHIYFGPSLSVHFTFGKPEFTVSEGNTYPMPPWSFETGFKFGYQF